MQRCFTNILTEEVAATAAFYQDLLAMKPQFESDWFVSLADAENPSLELGILKQTSEIVPARAQRATAGVILTFVVNDCAEVYERAQALGVNVVEAPREMPYGQMRMIVRDPAGTFVDISSPV
ncbi:glyoxalase [Stappia sp. BW2]|jgi:predicted enzyme related to lactoylglutathione lyase|uniref:VOC family protein n=1 Tax=Stappia sp. BW2 TaxID=2592622 RepID=UPI0011DEE6BB|nr:VOC family protein [Stappia sp. BW2]TYC75836.1 glyoxalase [Stappia sp. BW2]